MIDADIDETDRQTVGFRHNMFAHCTQLKYVCGALVQTVYTVM